MGRRPLPPGTYGRINVLRVAPSRYRAQARYRGQDGVTRTVSRFGDTKGRAEAALLDAFSEHQARGSSITRDTPVGELLTQWLEEVANSGRSVQTKEQYRYSVARYLRPQMGALRIAEATTGRCTAVLGKIETAHGPAAAKTARSVLNGVFKLAQQHDVIAVNPVGGTKTITQRKRKPRALTPDEITHLMKLLKADKRALALDLPDLIEFGLATGCRIGEVLALRESLVPGPTAEITATAIRIKGTGMVIQERPKSSAGWRIIALPVQAITLLERRRAEPQWAAREILLMNDLEQIRAEVTPLAFPAPDSGTLRDPSNTASDIRETLDRLGCPTCGGFGWHTAVKKGKPPKIRIDKDGDTWNAPCDGEPPFTWVTFHTFRRTVATQLLAAGLPPNVVADHMGHEQPSMTLDRYAGRAVVSAEAARVLER